MDPGMVLFPMPAYKILHATTTQEATIGKFWQGIHGNLRKGFVELIVSWAARHVLLLHTEDVSVHPSLQLRLLAVLILET